MKYREFVYVGEPAPQITEHEHAAFYLQFQKSILASLKKRELLTHSQYDRCIEEIEKQFSKNNHSQAETLGSVHMPIEALMLNKA